MAACYQSIVTTLFIIMASTTPSAGQTPPSPKRWTFGNRVRPPKLLEGCKWTYTIIFKVLDGLLFDPSKCEVAIAAPLVACTIYPRQGIIRAPITFIALLQGLLPILIFTVGDYVAA
ncbi:hypothetical protein ACFE04_013163 [Oxalis oulophora]